MRPVHVAILWHQHQPVYRDLATGRARMPWVRLHAIKDYYGMARLAQRHPGFKHTVNLVPSLVRQLTDYIEGGSDDYLDRARPAPEDLSEEDVDFVLNNFFSANWESMVRIHPRYGELLARRKMDRLTAAQARRHFSADDLRDLQVWSILAWFHPIAVTDRPELAALMAKGAGFTEQDKTTLLAAQQQVMQSVIPMHRELESTGVIELTASPYYHPIVPLLCDMACLQRAMPDTPLPAGVQPLAEDARVHIARSVESHEAVFGRRPTGMWPSEGSVSSDMVPLLAEAGIRWFATDEDILFRSLDGGNGRGAAPEKRADALYRPWRVRAGEESVNVIFRDHGLSDSIGFRYQDWKADHAVTDLVRSLREIGRACTHDPCLVSIILDGENCWEHYANQGIEFIEGLYRALTDAPDLIPVRAGEFLQGHPPERELETLFPGSWINSNFYIWSGHEEDRRAWEAVYRVRDDLVKATDGTLGPGDQAKAWESLYIAEGSDWFWWYGDDHFSGMDDQFDALFRDHLKNVYTFLGRTPPDFLNVPIAGAAPVKLSTPRSLLHVKVDGRATSYFEWLGAGMVDLSASGAMAQAGSVLFDEMHFGFSHEELFLRLDPVDDWRERAPGDLEMLIRVRLPEDKTVRIQDVGSAPRSDDLLGLKVAAGSVVEVALPLEGLGVRPGDEMVLTIRLERDGQVLQRIPAQGELRVDAPAEGYEVHYWQV